MRKSDFKLKFEVVESTTNLTTIIERRDSVLAVNFLKLKTQKSKRVHFPLQHTKLHPNHTIKQLNLKLNFTSNGKTTLRFSRTITTIARVNVIKEIEATVTFS